MHRTTIILLGLLAATTLRAQIPLAPGAELKLVAGGYKFTEGPAVDASGNVYFTDQPNDRILKWTAATGKLETFMQPCGRANGLDIAPDGFLIACADDTGELRRIDVKTGKFTILLDHFGGRRFNGPNDVWVNPAGGMFFTDPFYKRDYWHGREQPDQERQRVFYLPPDGKVPVIADDTLVQPNGIIGSPDGKILWVADIGDHKTYQYAIAKDGSLHHRQLFCGMGSDGMTRDTAGNIYLTGKGVTVFDRNGRKLGEIPVAKNWTANVCFCGPAMKTLFITAMDSVFTIEMAVAGTR